MKKILIVTGGSGGHVIPALSIYDHLKEKFHINLITDRRGAKFINKNNYNFDLIHVPNLFSKLYLLPLNLLGFLLSIIKSYFFLKKKKINYVISTGGYMSIPFCLASKFLNLKLYLFEPNSVLGRANNFMLPISKNIICYDDDIKLFPKKFLKKIYLTKPILRKEIYLYETNQKNDFLGTKKILIIGGSQGAEFFDEKITELILNISKQFNIEVSQQVLNIEKKKIIRQKYENAGINYKLFEFDENLYQKFSEYDIAITRSGASTISELSYFNLPFIAIPFPYAKDDHQYYNAKFYESRNCCWLFRQKNLDINQINTLLIQLFNEKTAYFIKKQNLANISNQNTWNNVNKKLLEIFNEN